MNRILDRGAFAAGVIFTFGLSAGINYKSYLSNNICGGIADCGWSFGFPFDIYFEGSIVHLDNSLWAGLTADILITLLIAVCVGMLAGKIIGRLD
jgi:hypothetical protein